MYTVIPEDRASVILDNYDHDLEFVSRNVNIVDGNKIKVTSKPDDLRLTSLSSMKADYPTALEASPRVQALSQLRGTPSLQASPKDRPLSQLQGTPAVVASPRIKELSQFPDKTVIEASPRVRAVS